MSSGGLSIGELVGTISLDDALTGGMDKIASAIGISSESFKAMAGFAGLAGAAVVGATTAIVALGTHGAQVADVQDAFDGLTSAAGSSADVMLGALREGTLGTISNFDLMKMANSTLGTGLVKSADDMKTLAAGAKLLADRTGGDTAQAFDTLTSAMASGRTASLKQMGLFVDNKVAVENYAASLHKNVGDLTDHEKVTALSQAALAALKLQLDANGPAAVDFGDNIDRGKVAVQNFIDNLSVAVAKSPVVAAGMESMGTALQAAFGGSQQDTVKTLMGFVSDFAIGLTYVGQGAVTAGTVFVTAWAGIQLIVLGVMTAVAAVGTGLVSLVAGLAQLASEIPGAGKLVEGFAVGATNLALAMDEVTRGLAEQTGAANQALAGNSELQQKLDGLSGAFVTARDAMEAAAAAQADLSSGSDKVRTGLGDVGTAAHLSAAEIKAMEDATRKGREALFDMAEQGAAKFQELQDTLTMANMTGVEARIFEIQLAQDKELAGYQGLALSAPALYQQITDAVIEKYRIMSEAAQGHFQNVGIAAEAAGFTTRDQMEQNAANAAELWLDMMASGKYTEGELEKAHKKYIDAVKAMDKDKTLYATQQFELIAGAASSILGSIFGKSKAAAIAAVIIDTAAAIVKTLAAYPFPWSLIPAAAVAAAGFAQLQKIKSTDAGFAMGTPQMAFQDFGRETTVALHGPEAVVTKHQGSNLADMILGAVTEREDRGAMETRAMREDLRQLHQAMPLWIRDAMQQGAATA